MTSNTDWIPRNRLEALTDGVYAVALTLLVLDLKIPSGFNSSEQLIQGLGNQIPNLLTWLLSFWVIVIYWESQVRISRQLKTVDAKTLRLDLVHLGLVSLVPFSTSLIGEYGNYGLAMLIYTANLWLISALLTIKVFHTKRALESDSSKPNAEELAQSAKQMLITMTVALSLAYVLPGWNFFALLIPKLLQKISRT